MTKVILDELKVHDRVYYIPSHLEKISDNAEEGHVTTLKDDKVWVRFRGPQGELTPISNLYK